MRLGDSTRKISGADFTLVWYHIDNPRFGPHVLIHAFAKEEGEAVILMLAWPRSLPSSDPGLPVKFEGLLDGLSLRAGL